MVSPECLGQGHTESLADIELWRSTGTLITMSASPYSGILDPIYMRLEKPDGILRRTADSSMLLEALLDIGEYHRPLRLRGTPEV